MLVPSSILHIRLKFDLCGFASDTEYLYAEILFIPPSIIGSHPYQIQWDIYQYFCQSRVPGVREKRSHTKWPFPGMSDDASLPEASHALHYHLEHTSPGPGNVSTHNARKCGRDSINHHTSLHGVGISDGLDIMTLFCFPDIIFPVFFSVRQKHPICKMRVKRHIWVLNV
ncbi:hypothetical protein NPIL_60311 [Nephila pilipes]|uniref:Uncharacterized protein n=1 Tax=Nephila pilipes TaxID=299642 RepID=A0A8X6NYP4_NEPPI|nr:hypothetical protein NPIL_60311 [Nephila pilipes]